MALLATLESRAGTAGRVYFETESKQLASAIKQAEKLLRQSSRRRSRRLWEHDIGRAIKILDMGLALAK